MMFSVLSRFNRREFSLMLVLGVFAIVSILFSYLILPKIKTYRAVLKTESALALLAETAGESESQLADLQADIKKLERRLHGDMANLPEKEIDAYVIGQLQRMSWENNVQLVGIEPSAGETIESYHEMLFQVSLSGDYFDMYRWLREVGNDLGFVLIKKYRMRPVGSESNSPKLAVNLTMATYRAMQ